MPLLLVRHAHAHARRDWSGDDRLRPLSSNGVKQAEGLIATARKFTPVTRVLSSPYTRCVQTVQPLAATLGLGVEEVPELEEGQSSAAVRLVRALAGKDVAICTHGDVIVEVLVTLADEDRVDLGPNPRQAKGSVWVLDGSDGSFSSAQYLPPVLVETV
ncbi:MAG TPA: phosphoglycerate mutase family protein [Acidimicrobiales bacterium]|nr:phosphoglycerate mutase family protein [Acidimicrobiales bacterium]